MKRILFFILLIPFIAKSQDDSMKYVNYRFEYGKKMARVQADSVFNPPLRDTVFHPSRVGSLVTRPFDGKTYKWDGEKWGVFGEGGVGSFNTRYSITKGTGDSAQLVGDVSNPSPLTSYGVDANGNRTFIRPAPDTTKTIDIIKSATVANLSALKASDLWSKGIKRMWTQGYYSPGDGGAACYELVDTCNHTADDMFYIHPTGAPSTTKYHLRIENKKLNFMQIGGRPNWTEPNGIPDTSVYATYDNWPYLNAALLWSENNKDKISEIDFPSGQANYGYFFSKTIDVRSNVALIGDVDGIQAKTIFLFPHISFMAAWYPNPGDVVLYSGKYYQASQKRTTGNAPSGTTANNSYWNYLGTSYGGSSTAYDNATEYYGANLGTDQFTMKNIRLQGIAWAGLYMPRGGTNIGLFMNTHNNLENVSVNMVHGRGIYLRANAADVPYSTNANGFTWKNVEVNYNADDGAKIIGGDVNGHTINKFSATANMYVGLVDSALINGHILGYMGHINGGYGSGASSYPHSYITQSGNLYLATQDNINHAPSGTTANNTYWTYIGTATAGQITDFGTWSADSSYRAGAELILSGEVEATGVYIEDWLTQAIAWDASYFNGGHMNVPIRGVRISANQFEGFKSNIGFSVDENSNGYIVSGSYPIIIKNDVQQLWSAPDATGYSTFFIKSKLRPALGYIGAMATYDATGSAGGRVYTLGSTGSGSGGIGGAGYFALLDVSGSAWRWAIAPDGTMIHLGGVRFSGLGSTLALDTSKKLLVIDPTTKDIKSMNWPVSGVGGTTTNALSISSELHSGGSTTFDGSAAISLAIQAGSITNSMLAGSIALSKLSITGTPDGTKYLRDDGTWQTVSTPASPVQNLTSQYTNTGNTSTSETDLMSLTLASGQLANDGDWIEISASFTYAANANVKTLKFKFGSYVATLSSSSVTSSGGDLLFTGKIIRTSATTQKIIWKFDPQNGTQQRSSNSSGTETLSGTVVTKFTGQSDTASNDITQNSMQIVYHSYTP